MNFSTTMILRTNWDGSIYIYIYIYIISMSFPSFNFFKFALSKFLAKLVIYLINKIQLYICKWFFKFKNLGVVKEQPWWELVSFFDSAIWWIDSHQSRVRQAKLCPKSKGIEQHFILIILDLYKLYTIELSIGWRGDETQKTINFGRKLSFPFPERLQCCYIYFHCSYLYNYYNTSPTLCDRRWVSAFHTEI